jgi:uncharacterized protein YhdP
MASGAEGNGIGMKRWFRILAAVLIFMAALALAAGFLATRWLDPDSHRTRLIESVNLALNRDVSFDQGDFSLWLRPALTFRDVRIREKDVQTDFITADRLHFKLSLLPLLRKQIVLYEVVLENPRIALIRGADGAFNIGDWFENAQEVPPFGVARLQIQNGVVHFTDRQIAPKPQTTSLERITLRLGRLQRGKAADISLKATVMADGKNAEIALDGALTLANISESLMKSSIDAAVKLSGLETGRLWPYYSRYVPFRELTGRLDIDARYAGTVAQFTSEGTLALHDAHFAYPAVFPSPLTPKSLRTVYAMKRNAQAIDVTRLDVTLDGVTITASGLFADLDTDDPIITAKAATSEIPWDSHRRYVPFGVIPKDAADFIAQKIKGGVFRFDEGRLHGRISQIAHMEKGDNCNVLHVRGRVRQGVLAYAPDVPVAGDISGTLELKGRDFILHGMTGKFGDAPFSLEGRLTDYGLATPMRYPFTLKMNPTPKETAWLAGDEVAKKFSYVGTSVLTLSGDGTAADYKFRGDWDLTGADYKYSDLFAKPSGKANRLRFDVNLAKGEARFSAVRFNLPPLALEVSARYRYTGKRALSLTADSNAVRLDEIAPLLPKIEKFAPRGQVALSVKARSGPPDLADLRWRGEIALTDVSFNAAEAIRPVRNMTGKIHLRGRAVETSQMALQIGDSRIFATGRVANLQDPVLSVAFSSAQVAAADLGLQHPQQPVIFRNVSGTVAYGGRDLKINSLTFHLNDSIFNVGGTVSNIAAPHPGADIRLTSPSLVWRDAAMLGGLDRGAPESAGKTSEPRTAATPKTAVPVEANRRVRLTNLQTTLIFDRPILYVKAFAADILGGTIDGNGRIDLADAASPRYSFDFNLDNISSEQGLKWLDIKEKTVTGAFSAKGTLSARGETVADLKKTVLGNVRIHMEEGMLRQLASLSKIFSILNVSQLFKFQLPDMVRGGMPYNRIIAALSFENGIVSTKDLFIASDAMNISAVGAIDMPKGEFVKTVVGVQPLQTVDKVVSRIPVVGWILTDENRTVMTVYFEVRGSVDNPAVTAISVKSLARGVFDIFKNIFQLPAKLFTDTGEVLFGR